MKTVVWTDGSCNANGMRGRGGWAALIEQAGTVREISGSADGTTQHRMELTAVCEAFEALTGAIEVRTDTPYVEAPARRRKPRRASWRDLPAAEMGAHLLETPTICDRCWTDEPRLPREPGPPSFAGSARRGRGRRDGDRVLTRPTRKAVTPADSALNAPAAIARANFRSGLLPFRSRSARPAR